MFILIKFSKGLKPLESCNYLIINDLSQLHLLHMKWQKDNKTTAFPWLALHIH